MRMWSFLPARVPGGLRAVRTLASRANKVVAAATALVMAVALTVVAVQVAAPGHPGPPVQQPEVSVELPSSKVTSSRPLWVST